MTSQPDPKDGPPKDCERRSDGWVYCAMCKDWWPPESAHAQREPQPDGRFEEIRQRWVNRMFDGEDITWLVSEVERLRAALRVLPPEGGPRPDEIAKIRAMIEEVDAKLTPYGESEGFIRAYIVPAGPWNRLLGWARNTTPETLAASLAAQIPNQRAAEEAYRKAGELSQTSLNYEVRAEGAP